MSISERRAREISKMKNSIMDAALSIAEAKGWSGVSIRKIGNSISYSAPLLYSYFRDKEALMLALRERALRKVRKQMENAVRNIRLPKEAIQKAMLAAFDFAIAHPREAELIFLIKGVDLDIGQQGYQEVSDVLAGFLVWVVPPGPGLQEKLHACEVLLNGCIAQQLTRNEHPARNWGRVMEKMLESIL